MRSLLFYLLLVVGPLLGSFRDRPHQVVPASVPPPICVDSVHRAPFGPSNDLYCIELVPRPEVYQVKGSVELGRAASPFDVAVDIDGHQKYDLSVDIGGLPDPSTLGSFRVYVAWVTPPVLAPMVKLGVVGNGHTHLGPVAFDKFMVLITAESDSGVTERTGKLVLRGTSPSIRMQRHDMLLPYTAASTAMDSMHSGHHAGHGGEAAAVEWAAPPMRPGFLMPMLGMEGLVPPVAPWLPPTGSKVPLARPRELRRLKNGDVLALDAAPVRRVLRGNALTLYAFNGQYPGPLIQVDAGATITVNFTNHLDQPTSVHWHGIRLDNRYDGAVGVTQDAVPPGGRFQYRVHFPDAGIFWYHPHVREDIQQELGLYGNILVRSPKGMVPAAVNDEEVVTLDDLLLGEDGSLVPFGMDTPTHALMGRFGNLFLTNGEPVYSKTVARGAVVRYYFTNVSNTRTFNVSFTGGKMKLVGGDGGAFERGEWVESVPIAPAQRYIVDVAFSISGNSWLLNRVQSIDHILGNFISEVDTLGAVHVGASPAAPDHQSQFARLTGLAGNDLGRFRSDLDRPADRELLLTVRPKNIPYAVLRMLQMDLPYANPVEWSGTMPMMDWLITGPQAEWVLRDPATGKENMAIDWRFRVGDLVKIHLANDRGTLHPMQHPIHLHGQRFVVLSYNGVPNPNLVWKDVVLLPVGATADILVEVSNPGKWMIHCHVAEHLQSGMMTVFEVGPAP